MTGQRPPLPEMVGPERPHSSKYSAAGVVLEVLLAPELALRRGASGRQRGLFQVWLQCVQGSSVVKEGEEVSAAPEAMMTL